MERKRKRRGGEGKWNGKRKEKRKCEYEKRNKEGKYMKEVQRECNARERKM